MERTRNEVAEHIFRAGYSCSQAVLYAFCNDFGLDSDAALRLACGFGAGMGRTQEVCGAITGGIMVLGLKYGRGENDDSEAKNITYTQVRDFMKIFTDKHGSTKCLDLLDGCNLQTEEGQERFASEDLMNTVCIHCIKDAVDIIDGMLS